MATSTDDKILRTTKFPIEFNQKVDIQKVNADLMKKWIAGRIQEILGSDDDVVIELCFGLFEGARYPDIKKMQIQLTGFLDKDTPAFCKELWKLCLSAQANPQGVPQELVEAKKAELMQEKMETGKISEQVRVRKEDEQRREQNINAIRDRERGDRGRGRGGGRGGDNWGGRRGEDRRNFDRGDGRGDDRDRDFGRGGGRGFERRFPRSRSPPPRRDSRDRGAYRTRASDSYIPRGREHGRRRDVRRRSTTPRSQSPVSARSRSRSRSPPARRRRSPTRSRSPPRRYRSITPVRRSSYRGRGYRGERGRARSPVGRKDSRSPVSSISRSPPRKRRRSPTQSPSRSPSPRRSRRRNSGSVSRSNSSPRSLKIAARAKSHSRERTRLVRDEADVIAARGGDYKSRDERRLTRSISRSISPGRDCSRSDSQDGTSRKRRRSMQRYEPSKRRRNSSSMSPPLVNTKKTKADIEIETDRRSLTRENSSKQDVEQNEMPTKTPQAQAAELKEKLLREKIKKMRKTSIESRDK